MNLKDTIAKNAMLRDSDLKAFFRKLKVKAPRLHDRFAPILARKNVQLGADSWLDIGKDLVDLAANVKASKEIDKSEQRALEIELKKIQETNAALEKQQKLQNQLERAKLSNPVVQESAFSAVMSGFLANPMALVAVGGLVGLLIFMRRKGR